MLGEGIEQLRVFVVFAVLGLALMAVYLFGLGLFRSRLAIILFDGIFGVASIYAVFAVNLAVNNGEFRLFVFLGLAMGCVICAVTCKTLLDKASAALYNLCTKSTEDEANDAHVSQQKDIGLDSSGGNGSAVAGVHTADNSHSNVLAKSTRRKASKPNRRIKKTRRSHSGTNRVHENRRIRKGLGGAKQ